MSASRVGKILITGASPDQLNRNTVLRGFVSEGFRQILGLVRVREVSLTHVPAVMPEFRPDLVLVFGSCMPDECDYSALRHSCNQLGAKLAFWLHDDPYEFDHAYKATRHADYVFSNDAWATLHYSHPATHHLGTGA